MADGQDSDKAHDFFSALKEKATAISDGVKDGSAALPVIADMKQESDKVTSLVKDPTSVMKDPVAALQEPGKVLHVAQEMGQNADNSVLQKAFSVGAQSAVGNAAEQVKGMTSKVPGGEIAEPVIEAARSVGSALTAQLAKVMQDYGPDIKKIAASFEGLGGKMDEFHAPNGVTEHAAAAKDSQMAAAPQEMQKLAGDLAKQAANVLGGIGGK